MRFKIGKEKDSTPGELLISVHPKWIRLMETGEKTIEVRKKWPEGFIGTVYVYETGTGMVVGKFEVTTKPHCHCTKHYHVPGSYAERSRLNGGELDKYIGDSWWIYFIEIENYTKIKPIPIREFCGVGRGPQSYAYLRKMEYNDPYYFGDHIDVVTKNMQKHLWDIQAKCECELDG